MKHIESFKSFDKRNDVIKEDENLDTINEDFGTIAIGVMLAYFGIKTLKIIGRAILGAIGERQEIEPEKLKKIVEEIVLKAASETGTGVGVLQAAVLKKELDQDIESGKIKTLGDIRKHLEDYQNKETK
jgi:hypothetical protein